MVLFPSLVSCVPEPMPLPIRVKVLGSRVVEERSRTQGGLGNVQGAHVSLGFLDAGWWTTLGGPRWGEGGGSLCCVVWKVKPLLEMTIDIAWLPTTLYVRLKHASIATRPNRPRLPYANATRTRTPGLSSFPRHHQAPPGFQEQSQEEDHADRLKDYADLQATLEVCSL